MAGFDMLPDELSQLEGALAEYGGLAATSLADISYQTPPMVEAQARGHETVLDLSLARPRPKLTKLAQKMAAIIRRLPEQTTDPGVFEDIEQEIRSLRRARGRANQVLLPDDE